VSASPTVRLHAGNAARFFGHGLPFALVLALVLGAATYPLAQRVQRTYTSTATLVLYAKANVDRGGVLAPSSLPPDGYRTALLEGDLLRRTLQTVNQDATLELTLDQVDIRVSEPSLPSLLSITVRHREPGLAAEAANAVAAALMAWDQQRALEPLNDRMDVVRKRLAVLDAELAAPEALSDDQRVAFENERLDLQAEAERMDAQLRTAIPVANLESFAAAVPPSQPSNPAPAFTTGASVVLALLLVYAGRLLRTGLNPRAEDAADLPVRLDAPQLAFVSSHASGAQALRVRTLLQHLGQTWPPTLLVTGSHEAGGSHALVAALARSFENAGHRPLVLDVRPFQTDAKRRDSSDWAGVAVRRLQAADPDRLASRVEQELRVQRSEHDVIIVHAAPADQSSEAFSLAPLATLLIATYDGRRTPLRSLERIKNDFASVGLPVALWVDARTPKRSRRPSRQPAKPSPPATQA
jgi:hypothetical protein